MPGFRHQGTAWAVFLLAPLSSLASEAPPSGDAVALAAAPDGDAATAAVQRIQITSVRRRLDAARNGLSPDTGSSLYRFDRQDLAQLPQGDSTPLNQVVLQAPGVVQDSYGQLHVRGDHANVQYRLDGVVLPESISGFGQSLQTRLADRVDVLTGALPAQYGDRTAAVVDIKTKGQAAGHVGSLSLSAGSQGRREFDGELGGSRGAFSYYLTGSALHDPVGIENPTPARSAIHDTTNQGKGFGDVSYLIDDTSRVSLMAGVSDSRFQIPDLPGVAPVYTLAGAGAPDSATLDARQRERNRFGVLSLQSSVGDALDYQVALFRRVSDVHYTPDVAGDLVFKGIAADILRSNTADGVQADLSAPLGARHTLRGGLFLQHERYRVGNTAQVFPADASGQQTGTTPETLVDNSALAGTLWGLYLQDEWQPVKALTVNYGLRYDQARTVVDEHQFSPRFGVVYDLSPDLRLHAGYARYFTPPPTEKIDTTSVQKFLGTTNALPSDANTAVRSERANYLDAGLSFQLTPTITLGVDAYDREVSHLQDEGQFGNALIYSAFNYAQGRIRGIEFSGSWHARDWGGYANLAWSRAMGRGIETGQFNFDPNELAYLAGHWVHLDHDQSVTASAGLSHRGPQGLMLSADALVGSGLRRGFANTAHLPGYAQVNVAARRPLELGGAAGSVELRVSVLNLFDRVYELRDGTGIGVGAPQYGPRRTLELGLRKSF